MSLVHFSHKHPLILKEELDANGDDKIACYGCQKPISAAAVYTCSTSDGCDDFCLHKTCAELPKEIKHPMHDQHPLTLHARHPYQDANSFCDVCKRDMKGFTYGCRSCNFDYCVTCNIEDRVFHHEGHKQHALTLLQREASFKCDACCTEAKDSSYACNSCQFWMHKSCASSPTKVEPDFHHHPLSLIYSLPDIHRTFTQYCRLCDNEVYANYWLYYCHKCTYFVHIKCVASSKPSTSGDEKEEVDEQEDVDEHDLVRFPVPSNESIMNLIIDQYAKEFNNLEEDEATPVHPPQTIDHWSHEEHPLILMEEYQNNEIPICNGCVQPISAAYLPFYGCIGCNFFLHRFCVELAIMLPAAYSRHRGHPLFLSGTKSKFDLVTCYACEFLTNGFYFECEMCDIEFDIGCCFLPNRIKHESHKHPLVINCASSESFCRACGTTWTHSDLFKCEITCRSGFQIHKRCAMLPSTMRHRWDPHPIRLIYPPFPHEGVIYCEICEEEVDPNYWLYHCRECDQSFHTRCLRPLHNVKLGDKLLVVGIHPHPLTFVFKLKRDYGRPLLCSRCGENLLYFDFMFECLNCDILVCVDCAFK